MKAAVIALTSGGRKLAETISAGNDNICLLPPGASVAVTLAANWKHFDGFICIMAAGIVVRAIAPLLEDKRSDPCVVVMDEQGRNVISLLAGHLGGGNALAHSLAAVTGGTAVITTASDTLGLTALDLWARHQQLAVESPALLTRASSLLVNKGSIKTFSEVEVVTLPPGLIRTSAIEEAELLITSRRQTGAIPALRPRHLVVGIGCNRGTPAEEFEEAIAELFTELGLSLLSVRNLASIDVKNDEEGLLLFAEAHGWPIDFFHSQQINTLTGVTVSAAAVKAVGAIGVAEPTALLSANTNILLSRKRKWQNITMAVAQAPFTLSAQVREQSST